MPDYKFLRVVVMICATLVNTHTRARTHAHTHKQTNKPAYIFWPAIISWATRSPATAEIARFSGCYTIQGHSRSLMLVPFETLKAHAISYKW